MYLTREMGYDVYAACANTGGFSEQQLKENEERAYQLGAKKYVTLDVILDFEADQKELLEKIQKEVDEIARGYTVEVNLDLDI